VIIAAWVRGEAVGWDLPALAINGGALTGTMLRVYECTQAARLRTSFHTANND